MPKITRISTTPYTVPLKAALTWGGRHKLAQLDHVLIRVELSDGAVGIAEATPRPSIYGETQASIKAIIEWQLAPMLAGRTVEDFEAIAALSGQMAHIKNNNTAKGALDMALHQALADSRGENLGAYLGVSRERIQLSTIVSTGSAEAVMADVEAAYRAGLRVFKVKIGRDIECETETIRRLIETYPPAQFYVDANETLPNAEAADILDGLFELGVLYCEEALPVHQLRNRRELRRNCKMPIIADDSAFTLADLEREIEFDSFDILNIKTARTGFSESRRMLDLVREAGKGVMIGSQASSLLGCTHAALFAADERVNCASECSFYLKTEADLTLAPPIVDGYMELDAAGGALSQMQAILGRLT
ncbi:MAG: enolase [Chloroflexi bacterium]|nr:enolase [Chloroflexota bacterium]